MTTPLNRDEIVELMARAIAQSDGLDFDEVCGVDADPDNGECDSGTCVAAHFEEHDASYARSIYRSQAQAALRALEAAGCQIVQGEPVGYLHTMHMELKQEHRRFSEVGDNPFGKAGLDYDDSYLVTITPLFAGKVQP